MTAPRPVTEPPLDAPFPRAPLLIALRRFCQNYASFRGRASRAEFWWPILVVGLFPTAVQVLTGVTTGDWRPIDGTVVTTLPEAIVVAFGLVTILPVLAVTWRRLHHTGRSGAWFFLIFLPVLGIIWLVVLLALPGPRVER
ncbi:DUF805 domain-containing protein [Microbacterium oleivorans]|uniref:DUF805 domain-containing protein n=1 Tax=Microbacterium oleivorans TaxID=273677 RepID=A0A7D5EVL2_9MICO|nr:DUF805 domain-containing protein [Microbacterium oleivorans]QLD10784.1 DUF805 domain-containing protein [Microbacterium oleivorans]